jgi:hypothetical protein
MEVAIFAVLADKDIGNGMVEPQPTTAKSGLRTFVNIFQYEQGFLRQIFLSFFLSFILSFFLSFFFFSFFVHISFYAFPVLASANELLLLFM